MEPRPSRPNRPASSASRSSRPPWVPPEGSDDLTAPRNAEIYGAPPPAAGGTGGSAGPWYGPHGSLGPEPPEYRATKPPMPIKPRNERGNKWLRYLLGALLLALAVGGAAFAITWFLDDDDEKNGQSAQQTQVTATATVAAAAPEATQTPETLAEPTATSEAPQPTPTSATVDPTATSDPGEESGAGGEEAGAGSETGDEPAASRDAASYLPTLEDLDGAWTVQAEGNRSLAEVGAALGEGGEEILTQFGWQENPFRDFTREAAPEETFFVSVSVHSFDTPEGASEALTYFSDILASGIYQTAPAVDIGDATVALEGSQDGYNLYALYVLDGNYMIRFGGSSQTGDPAPYVNAVAEQVVEGTTGS